MLRPLGLKECSMITRLCLFLVSCGLIGCGNLSFSDSTQNLEGTTQESLEARDTISPLEESAASPLEESAGSAIPKNSEFDDQISFPEPDEEDIVAIPPTIISGAHLACASSSAMKSLNCGIESKSNLLDVSGYEVQFVWHSQQGGVIKLDSHLLKDSKLYQVLFPDHIQADTSLLAVQIKISGTFHSVYTKDSKILDDVVQGSDQVKDETSEVSVDSEKEKTDVENKGRPEFVQQPILSACLDAQNNPDLDVVIIRAGDPIPDLMISSFLIITANSNDSISGSLRGVDQMQGLCIDSDSNSTVSLNIATHVNQIVIFGNSNSVNTLNFEDTYTFNQAYGSVDSNQVSTISGRDIDCDKVNIRTASNAVVNCSSQ